MGTLGSRSLFHMGHAVQLAAEEARDKIAALRQELGEPEGANTPVADLFQKRYGMQAGNIVGSGAFRPDYESPSRETGQSRKVTPFWMIGGAGAEVEVDTETGHVRIAKLVCVVDAGKAVNPKIVETQISGGAMMQLGFTLFEKIHLDGGQVTNASLADYKIPGLPRPAGDAWKTFTSSTISRTGRSAPRASARARCSASRRPSPTPSTMRSACA